MLRRPFCLCTILISTTFQFDPDTVVKTGPEENSDTMEIIQPGQSIPWNILPEGSYRHPSESGSRARTFLHAADASVELPLSSNTLYITAQGSCFSGVININDDGKRGANVMQVDTRMYYTAPQLSDSAQAWRERREQGQDGLAIKVRLWLLHAP
jgi:hypothetical protein